MKCTIKAIAEELNLSRNTVARVLSGKDGVSAKTKKLVLDKAREMKHSSVTPEENRILTNPIPDSVLFLTRADQNDPRSYSAVIQAAEKILQENQYRLVLSVLGERQDDAFSVSAERHRDSFSVSDEYHGGSLSLPAIAHHPSVKGVILVDIADDSIYEALLQLSLPIAAVRLSRELSLSVNQVDLITTDQTTPIHRLAASQIKKGAHSFTFVKNQPQISGNALQTFTADKPQITQNHLQTSADMNDLSSQYFSVLQKAMDQFHISGNIHSVSLAEAEAQLQRGKSALPDVFFCCDDWTAIRLMHTAQLLNYRIPEDFSIIGSGDSTEAEHTLPALTTIRIPEAQLGRAAARCILERIEYPDTPHVRIQYLASLISRDSA